MKKISFLVALLSLFLLASDVLAASSRAKKKSPAKPSFCKTVVDVRSSSFIYKNSAPLRNSSGAISGFRQEPTLICKQRSGTNGCTNRTFSIFNVAGKSIGSCPWASAHGFAGGRARCTMNTGGLRRTAVKSTKSPTVLIKINSGTCVSVPDAGKCYGSVKGLCNRTLG